MVHMYLVAVSLTSSMLARISYGCVCGRYGIFVRFISAALRWRAAHLIARAYWRAVRAPCGVPRSAGAHDAPVRLPHCCCCWATPGSVARASAAWLFPVACSPPCRDTPRAAATASRASSLPQRRVSACSVALLALPSMMLTYRHHSIRAWHGALGHIDTRVRQPATCQHSLRHSGYYADGSLMQPFLSA